MRSPATEPRPTRGFCNGAIDVPLGGQFVAPCRRQLDEDRRPQDGRPHPVEGASRGCARQRRSGNPGARRPEGRSAQFGCGIEGRRAWLRLCRWRPEHRRVGHPARSRLPGADPLFARPGRRGGSADHRPGADALRLPRRSSVQRLLQPTCAPAAAMPNYRHDELEDTGEIATRASSARAAKAGSSWSRRSASGWGGTSGVQYLDRNAKIRGEEKFLPDSQQTQAGPVHAADPRQRPLPLRGRRPRRVQQARTPKPTSSSRRPPGRATSRPCPARLAASTNSRPAGAPD